MSEFKFRFGKHVGKTLALVQEIDPQYIKWAKDNAPNLLKEPKITIPKPTGPVHRREPPEDSEVTQSSLGPNVDFLKQKNNTDYGK